MRKIIVKKFVNIDLIKGRKSEPIGTISGDGKRKKIKNGVWIPVNKNLKNKSKIVIQKKKGKETIMPLKPIARFSQIKEINRKDIIVQPEIFQGRQNAYSEESVNKIVSEGFDKSNAPIEVWYDKKLKKYIVISGHSRFEASERLYKKGDKSLKIMPVKEFLGDKKDAVNYAILESNRTSTQEGFLSDVKAVKRMMVNGYNKNEMLKYIKPKSYLEKVVNYTYLNPNGKFIEYLDSDSKVSFPYIERNAEWVGQLKKMYEDKLTNQHENEIFDFFYMNDKKGLTISKQSFFDLVNKKINNKEFNKNKPLNLRNVVNTSGLINNAQNVIKQYETDIENLSTDIKKYSNLAAKAKISNDRSLYKKFKMQMDNMNEKIIDYQIKIEKIKNSIKKVENETIKDLFSV